MKDDPRLKKFRSPGLYCEADCPPYDTEHPEQFERTAASVDAFLQLSITLKLPAAARSRRPQVPSHWPDRAEVALLEGTARALFCAVQAQQAGTGYVPDPELVLNHEELWTGVFAIAAMRFGWVVHVGPPPSW